MSLEISQETCPGSSRRSRITSVRKGAFDTRVTSVLTRCVALSADLLVRTPAGSDTMVSSYICAKAFAKASDVFDPMAAYCIPCESCA